MGLKNLGLKSVYITDEDSIFDDFYKPALSVATRYDRAVGYFSSAMLALALQGVSGIAKGGARMRLIIGDHLDDDEYRAVKQGKVEEVEKRLSERLQYILSNPEDELLQYRLEILSLMVGSGRLEIKYALRRKGVFHQKVGVITDEDGECVVFQGSANETAPGILPSYNSETVSVYPSWKSEIFQEYGLRHQESFEKVWKGEYRETLTLDLPSYDYERLRSFRKKRKQDLVDGEKDLVDCLLFNKTNRPSIPGAINGRRYQLRKHQSEALEGWMRNQYCGLMALATGAGKTITAIHGAVRLYEELKRGIALVITVPYKLLAEQWCEELSKFNIEALRCWSGHDWRGDLESRVASFSLSRKKDMLAIVCVNATFKSEDVQKVLSSLPKSKAFLFVADECHRVGSDSFLGYLPENASLRLGLSATPWSKKNKKSGDLLKSYFGPVVAKYSIDQALAEGVLCPYIYTPYRVYLSEEEEVEYEEISSEIAKQLAAQATEYPDFSDVRLQAQLSRRARLLGSLESKFDQLNDAATSITDGGVLVYCGDGSVEGNDGYLERDLGRAARILSSKGLSVSRITAQESPRVRRDIISQFVNGDIDSIAAIRVLDEGFDLPYCREAFLLASSRNERQFIQRRGRVLRKMPGKEQAFIHDFICCPVMGSSTQALTRLVEEELRRGYEFARVAINRDEAFLELRSVGLDYGIDFDLIMAEEEEENESVFD